MSFDSLDYFHAHNEVAPSMKSSAKLAAAEIFVETITNKPIGKVNKTGFKDDSMKLLLIRTTQTQRLRFC